MITLQIAKAGSAQAMIDRAVRVVNFYGFVPVEEAPIAERAAVTGRTTKFDPKDIRFVRREERRLLAITRLCAVRGLGDKRMPVFLYKLSAGEKGSHEVMLELHVIGMRTAAAEALLITVADAIAQELGITDRLIHINSIGTGESAERYLRELTGFLRKQAEYLSAPQREHMQDDPIGTLLSLRTPKTLPLIARAPSSMDYLSDEERRHFWDVLEYLELAGKIYELSPLVVGSSDLWSHTLFEISYPHETPDGVERVPFTTGGRYDPLTTKALGPGTAAAMCTITFDARSVPQIKRPKWQPAAYLAHLGIEAKRRSIPVLEILREANIPVQHSLAYEQLGPQMAMVKRLDIPWLLLLGHKEAIANEVMVRNIRTNAQDSVPIPELGAFLHRKHVGI